MTGNIFSIKLLRPKYLLTLFLLIFAACALYLQSLKAPWVDECYSYYGVWHDNLSEFYDSMLTGINFSPPLYFLLNFIIQLIFPTSIEQLRIQSLVFIIIGIILSFLVSRKMFGTSAAFIATILVTSQSNLLFAQAQEARHYAMFFACGAWVLYMQSLDELQIKRYKWLKFLAHFCLCQVHYLGIIFSLLSGTGYFIKFNKIRWHKRIPISIFLSWVLSIVSYLFCLSSQQSILNSWTKPNKLADLLASYNGSLLILTIFIPIFIFLLKDESNKETVTRLVEGTCCSRPIVITSLLWFSLPLIFWILSHLTSLNLFVDRYFIPKEAAVVFLLAWFFNHIIKRFPEVKSYNLIGISTSIICIFAILIYTKRASFGLNKNTNYHHSLIISDKEILKKRAIVLQDDPSFFPNAYLNNKKFIFGIRDNNIKRVYNDFSSKIKIQ